MYCLCLLFNSGTDYIIHIKITVADFCRTYAYCFICKLCVKCFPVRL